MDFHFRRIAVINRGEAAMRLINAVQELRFEHGVDLETIALYTDVERTAMFVREADEAVCIDLDRPAGAGSPYLDLGVLERALVQTNADAAWVGWGFVAERPEFAELCERLGITFIGPRAEVMRRLGDKIEAKLLAEQADVPVAPWSGGPVETIEAARESAAGIGYPLMVKATAGGGGRGIRKVTEEVGLDEAFTSARSEGLKAFGDATVFMERVVSNARHVEVQVIGDSHGTVWAVGVRDCSMQRRNQKVIEESHCVALTTEQDRDLRAAAVRLAQAAGYENAGTVEFLYQPAEQVFSFLEVNTRLQVEHPVTELTTGLDLVKLQLHVASGGTLDGEPPPTEGYAIEARLNAEDPQRAFAPAPGVVEALSLPVGPGIRVDTGVAEGDVIPPQFDSMIAKIIAAGRSRDEALGRLHRALSQMTVLVRGGTTNKSFLLDLLGRAEVRSGEIDTSWLDTLTAGDEHLSTRLADVALVAASLDAAETMWEHDRDTFFSTASRGRSEVGTAIGHEVELRFAGGSYKVGVRQVTACRYEIVLDGVSATVEVARLGRSRSRMTFGGTSYAVVSSTQDNEHLVEVDGVSHRFSRDDAGVVRAPSASLVVRVDVSVDDIVAAGDRLAVVEAMKMEIAVHAPIGGRVRDVFAVTNAQVVAGAPLVRIEPETEDAPAVGRERVSLDDLAAGGATDGADLVLSCVLGYDVDDSRALALVEAGVVDADSGQLGAILDAFADLVALAPERLDDQSDGRGGAREYFNSYLRSCDMEREGLPEWFGDRLLRAVAQYGIDDLELTESLRNALYRIFVAQQRRDEHQEVVAALLRDPGERPELRDSLDRLIDATRRRAPAIAALSRSVRHRLFDVPHIERARAEIFSTMRTLATTVATADADSDAIDRLVGCSLPLMPIYAADDLLANADAPGRLIEILTHRFYRIRDIRDVRVEARNGLDVVRAEYRHKGRHVHVIAFRARRPSVADAIASVLDLLGEVAEPDTVVMDVYVPLVSGRTFDSDAFAADMGTALRAVDLPDVVRRACFATSRNDGSGEFVTFRRADTTGERPYWMAPQPAASDTSAEPMRFDEDIKFRGIHPMIARRLQMWRLANFEISPLPVTGEAHLFDCVARENPSDRRLVAVAEVRDITPVRDAAGRVVALPEVENVLVACLDAIRHARAALPDVAGLEWNRIMLYVWPPVDFSPDELDDVAHRLAPLTEGLGLEQVVVSGRLAGRRADGTPGEDTVDAVLRIGYEPGRGVTVRITEPATEPMQPLDDYTRKVVQTRRRGLTYPYEMVPMLAGPNGSWVEQDLDRSGRLVPVDRPPGENTAGIIVGVVSTPTATYPEGITRVAVLGDPTKAMGSITEDECSRLVAAIDLARSMGVPLEWLALSAGAKIAMDSGSENLDWVARVLRRIVEHTQQGGEINVVVAGVNVGAQPYWNAESTMLMHTKGILVMTPDSSMVLTGKQAIDYSGGVSAEDNFGIGGYERIMGPNGEAQYWAPSLAAACDLLHRHYELTYRAPDERWPRRVDTTDSIGRDVRTAPHVIDDVDFTTVGDIFSQEKNPDRKKPFDIRSVMAAVADTDSSPLERWPEMAEAEMAVVHDCRLGGLAVTMIGMESRPLPRHGMTPADGPAQWSAGTLFPLSSKKVARSINAASGSRPVVMLANLSGFDGSPESLRRLQLEYGAEIGRAIVNFDGPFVLCVVSRYHGGAFVVFSATLNDQMEVLAVEGSFASVIGGAPAAAVVFTRDVDARTRADERVHAMDERIANVQRTGDGDEGRLRAELLALRQSVRTEKMGEVAAEFDAVHSVERARSVGSVHRIIAAADLRAELIASVERGMNRASRSGHSAGDDL